MRRKLLLFLSLLLLIIGLCLLRSYRFKREVAIPSVKLESIQSAMPALPAGARWIEGQNGPVLCATARPGKAAPRIVYRPPFAEPIQALHLRITVSSQNLVPGDLDWQGGRIFVRWERDGKIWNEAGPHISTRGEELSCSLVITPTTGGAHPVVVFENYARSGDFLVDHLECTPVRQRTVWWWARWVVGACWVAWVFAALSGSPQLAFRRRAAAALLWVGMSAFLIFPGPWKRLTPLLLPYQLGSEISSPAVAGEVRTSPKDSPTPRSGVAQAAPVESKKPQGQTVPEATKPILEKEHWIITTKNRLKKLRHPLHAGLMMVVCVMFTCLVGRRRGVLLSAGLAVAIEAAQTAFGYGFDHNDLLDLVSSGGGILLGLLVVKGMSRCRVFKHEREEKRIED